MCRILHNGGDRAAVPFGVLSGRVLRGFISEYILCSLGSFVRCWFVFQRALKPYVGSSHMGIMDLIHTLTDAINLLSAALKFWREWRESKKKPHTGRRR